MSNQSSPRRPAHRSALTGTPTSVLVMGTAAVVAMLGVLQEFGVTVSLGVAVTTGVFLAGTTAAATDRNPIRRVLVTGGAIASAIGLVGAIVTPFVSSGVNIQTGLIAAIMLCIALSVFGIISTLTGGFGDRILLRTVPNLIITGLVIGVTGIGFQLRTSPEPLTGPIVAALNIEAQQEALQVVQGSIFTPSNPATGVATLGILLLVLFNTIYVVPDRLPIIELTARSNEDRVRTQLARITRGAKYGAILTLIIIPVLIILAVTPVPGTNSTIDLTGFMMPIAEQLTAAHAPRGVLFDLTLLLWGAVITATLPGLTRLSTSWVTRWLPVTLASMTGLVAVASVYSTLYESTVQPVLRSMASNGQSFVIPATGVTIRPATAEQLLVPQSGGILSPPGTSVAAVVLIGLLLLLAGLFITLSLLTGIQLLPHHATPGALASGSLFLAGTLTGLADASPATVVLIIICAIIVWDLAEYGTTLRTELELDTPMLIPVVTHSLGAVLVGGVSLTLALAVDRLILSAITVTTSVTVTLTLIIALVSSAALLSKSAF